MVFGSSGMCKECCFRSVVMVDNCIIDSMVVEVGVVVVFSVRFYVVVVFDVLLWDMFIEICFEGVDIKVKEFCEVILVLFKCVWVSEVYNVYISLLIVVLLGRVIDFFDEIVIFYSMFEDF